MEPRPRVVLAAIFGTLVIAACGSAGGAGTVGGVSAGLTYANCMRSHGVPSFPDPGGGSGGGLQFTLSVNPSSPAFGAAQRDCVKLLPGGGQGPAAATEQQKLMLRELARCMRAHGISGFPDPIVARPSSPVGLSLAFGRPGAFIVIPDTIDVRSPAFKQAAQTCGFPGTRRGSP